MSKKQLIKALKEELEREFKRLENSEYEFNHVWSSQFTTLMSYASGFAPNLQIGVVYDMVIEILNKGMEE